MYESSTAGPQQAQQYARAKGNGIELAAQQLGQGRTILPVEGFEFLPSARPAREPLHPPIDRDATLTQRVSRAESGIAAVAQGIQRHVDVNDSEHATLNARLARIEAILGID